MSQTRQSRNSITNETAKCVNRAEDRVPSAFLEFYRNRGDRLWTAILDGRKSSPLSNTLLGISRISRTIAFAVVPPPLVCEILRELCSLPRRIGTIYATKPYLYGIPIGRLAGSRLHQQSNAQTLACMRDTQRINASHPWANLLDRHLFVEGWKAGAEWAFGESRNLHSGSSHTDRRASDASGERGGNSMPPQASQQRRSADVPLASRGVHDAQG